MDNGWNDDEVRRFGKGLVNAALPSIALWAGIMLLFMWGIKVWADTPVVYKSWRSQECVRVDDPAKEHDCGNLPDKYDLVWVE